MKKNLSRSPRLYVPSALGKDLVLELSGEQAHYLGRVMRLRQGDIVRVFNGRDGEFSGQIVEINKRDCIVKCNDQTAQQGRLADIKYLFAPLKTARLDYLAQKATEMGAKALCPVITDYTQNRHFKIKRIIANTIEAAEQCNLTSIPDVCEPQSLDTVLRHCDSARQIVFCDEGAAQENPLKALAKLHAKPLALLIGPEGGFSPRERERLLSSRFVTPISLGPRILRADTAAVAGLTLLQAIVGDWKN